MLCLKLSSKKSAEISLWFEGQIHKDLFSMYFFLAWCQARKAVERSKKYANPRFQELPPIKNGRHIHEATYKHEAMFFMKKNTWKQAVKRHTQEVITGLSIPKRLHRKNSLQITICRTSAVREKHCDSQCKIYAIETYLKFILKMLQSKRVYSQQFDLHI